MARHLARCARAAGLVLACSLACESGPRRDARSVGQDTVAAKISNLLARADSIYIESSDSAASLWQAARGLAESAHDSVSMARALTGLGQAARLRLDLEIGQQNLGGRPRLCRRPPQTGTEADHGGKNDQKSFP